VILAIRRPDGVKEHATEGLFWTVPQQDNPAVRRALADAAALAQLQVDVLVRLNEADRAGDDGAVLRCHAELDHVMARMAEAELVRTGPSGHLAIF
jgi:hypothetical protein